MLQKIPSSCARAAQLSLSQVVLSPLLQDLLRPEKELRLPRIEPRHGVKLSDDLGKLVHVSLLRRRDQVLDELELPRAGEGHVEVLVPFQGLLGALQGPNAQVADARLEQVTLHAVLEEVVVHGLLSDVLEELDGLVVLLELRVHRRDLQLALVGLRGLVLRLEQVGGLFVKVEGLHVRPDRLQLLCGLPVGLGGHAKAPEITKVVCRLVVEGDGLLGVSLLDAPRRAAHGGRGLVDRFQLDVALRELVKALGGLFPLLPELKRVCRLLVELGRIFVLVPEETPEQPSLQFLLRFGLQVQGLPHVNVRHGSSLHKPTRVVCYLASSLPRALPPRNQPLLSPSSVLGGLGEEKKSLSPNSGQKRPVGHLWHRPC
mmetsp:Transcript_2480/g.9104  ORF Transcript_2480/g.9104 Transcript_2480/m.9104 type:complete len:373 (+) Transcript_2480:1013-2131(+)